MNELYVARGYMYFETNKNNCDEAIEDLFEICSKNGIELIVEESHLRNEDGEDID